MIGGLEFGCLFQFFTLCACHQFLSILHDKMGQHLGLGKHILSFVLLYNYRQIETSGAISYVVS